MGLVFGVGGVGPEGGHFLKVLWEGRWRVVGWTWVRRREVKRGGGEAGVQWSCLYQDRDRNGDWSLKHNVKWTKRLRQDTLRAERSNCSQ